MENETLTGESWWGFFCLRVFVDFTVSGQGFQSRGNGILQPIAHITP